MKEVRIHGRAATGVITTSLVLAAAAFEECKFAFAFPYFGNDRGGVPIKTFVRLSDRPIRERTPVVSPDYVIVQDPTLVCLPEVLEGVKPGGMFLVNTPQSFLELQPGLGATVVTVPASRIAAEVLGREDWTNTVMLGVFAAATGEIGLESLKRAVLKHFPGALAEKNVLALERGHEHVVYTCFKARPIKDRG